MIYDDKSLTKNAGRQLQVRGGRRRGFRVWDGGFRVKVREG